MRLDEPSLEALEALATSSDVRDRAFAAGALSLGTRPEPLARRAEVHDRVRETAEREHAAFRRRLRTRTIDGRALLAELEAAPLDARDHLLEEILGIAYPPLEPAPDREIIGYVPSGLAEILFTIENAGLHAGKTFVDLGSGLGKVAMLVALLTGARTQGIESNPLLVRQARAAARALGLDGVSFLQGDLEGAPLPAADVYYMFIPSPRAEDIVARLAPESPERRFLVFAARLNVARLPWLRPRGLSGYWLDAYEAGGQ